MEDAQEGNGVAKRFYQRQNRAIHKARSILDMDLEECREIAEQMCGNASLRALSVRQRWNLIEVLRSKGAKVVNPPLTESGLPREALLESPPSGENRSVRKDRVPCQGGLVLKDIYPAYLAQWEKKFPKRRPGFASNKQLAWIQVLWELDFTENKGNIVSLRKFLFRQTMNLPQGPVSDLAFLRGSHVEAVITPLKKKALSLQQQRRAAG